METLPRAIIKTRYAGPSNYRGARISVQSIWGNSSIPYPYELSGIDRHILALREHLKKFNCSWSKFTVGEDKHGLYFTVYDDFNLLEL